MNKQDIQTVLDALKQPIGFIGCREIDVKLREAITICEAALTEPSEPVIAYHYQYDTAFNQGVWGVGYNVPKNATQSFPLYRASKQAPLPELTDEQVDTLVGNWFAEDWAQEKARKMLDDFASIMRAAAREKQ